MAIVYRYVIGDNNWLFKKFTNYMVTYEVELRNIVVGLNL